MLSGVELVDLAKAAPRVAKQPFPFHWKQFWGLGAGMQGAEGMVSSGWGGARHSDRRGRVEEVAEGSGMRVTWPHVSPTWGLSAGAGHGQERHEPTLA